MSDIAITYQDQMQAVPPTLQSYTFATVANVYADGLSLLFPGETEESRRHYKCNTCCTFERGQKVYLIRDGGSYVVAFPVGDPHTGSSPGLRNSAGHAPVELKAAYTNQLQYRIREYGWNVVQNAPSKKSQAVSSVEPTPTATPERSDDYGN